MKRKNVHVVAVLAAVLAAISPVCAQDFTLTRGQKIDAAVKARDVALKSDKAPPVAFSSAINPISPGQTGVSDLSTQKGKVTVLYFFSAHCGRCVASSQRLGSIFLSTPRSELTVLGVMPSSDTFGEALAAATKEQVPFAVVQDDANKTYDAYGIDGYPMFCIIDPSGKVTKYCYADRMPFFVLAERLKNRRLSSAAPVAAVQPR